MNRVNQETWGIIAFILLALITVWNVVKTHLGSAAQKRTNERLREVEKAQKKIATVETTVTVMSNDLHMIKQFLMEKGK